MRSPLYVNGVQTAWFWPKMIQGSEDWLRIRRGIPTASAFKKVMTPKTMKLSASAEKYMIQLTVDCIETDVPPSFAGTKWSDRGSEREPEARNAFVTLTKLNVEEVGFCAHHTGLVGCSPDALIMDPVSLEYAAGLEIKCESPEVHAATVLSGEIPEDHFPQIHGGMIATGISSWHYFSWCPGLNYFHKIVYRDDYTATLEAALHDFAIRLAEFRPAALAKLRLPASEENAA